MPIRGENQVEPGDQEHSRGHNTSLEVLTHARRRQLLSRLSEEGTCRLAVLAREIASRETGSEPKAVPPAKVRAVYLDLRQIHVPALARAGLVEYAESDGKVSPAGIDDELERYLEAT